MSGMLFTPINVADIELANRVFMAPLTRMRASQPGDVPNALMQAYYVQRAGAGLIIAEATQISPQGKGYMDTPGIHSADQVAGWKKITQAVQSAGGRICLQLWHVGRVSHHSLQPDNQLPVSASALPYENRTTVRDENGRPKRVPCDTPRALTLDEIPGLLEDYRRASANARQAGFDMVEVHAAHGYLLHEFLSPLANQRGDAYGGSFDNRIRFPLEVFAAVRDAFDGVLGLRVSATDWVDGGWDLAQSTAFAQRARQAGCDFIHVSSGGISPAQKIAVGPLYQVPFARHIRQASGMVTTAVGLITEPQQAQAVLQAGDADLIALGRAFLYQPRWGWQAAAALAGQVAAMPAYWRCLPREAQAAFGKVSIGMR